MKHAVGFIGTGEIAQIHAQSILSAELGWKIAGGCDLNQEAADHFCNKYGAERFGSVEEMMRSPEIDTVYICTRHDSHVEYSIMAGRYGKNVLLEKPVSMDLESAIQLREFRERHPVRFAVGYNMRVAPSILSLKKKLKEYLAVPDSFRINMTGIPFMQGWAGDPGIGGGVLVCQGSHMFDLIADVLCSPICEVCVETRWIRQPENLEPNSAAALIRLENGVCGTLLMHDQGNRSYHIEPGGGMVNITIYSQQGTFDADAYGRLRYGTEAGLFEQLPPDTTSQITRWGYQNEAKYFAELLETGNSPLCTLDQAVNTAAVVEAARRSAREHRWITVKK